MITMPLANVRNHRNASNLIVETITSSTPPRRDNAVAKTAESYFSKCSPFILNMEILYKSKGSEYGMEWQIL